MIQSNSESANAKVKAAGKEVKRLNWEKISLGSLAPVLNQAIHFSSKTLSTTASAVGVRMAKDEVVDLPYVGFSTTHLDRRMADYMNGAGQAKVFKIASLFLEGLINKTYQNCTEEQLVLLTDEMAVMDTAFVGGDNLVDPRLRQLLFPTSSGYVALSPLQSTPFSKALGDRLQTEKDFGLYKHRLRAKLKIGGSNSQNVGRHVAQEVLVFNGVTENAEARKAYAIFYKGIALRDVWPRDAVESFKAWRVKSLQEGGLRGSVKRQEEEDHVLAVLHGVLSLARWVSSQQSSWVEQLGALSSGSTPLLSRGLLDEKLRSKTWQREFSTALVKAIEEHRTEINGSSLTETGDLFRNIATIEKAIRA